VVSRKIPIGHEPSRNLRLANAKDPCHLADSQKYKIYASVNILQIRTK
jgi:hypothetical protein